MSLKVYNTLTRTKEDFKTLEPNKVKMYCCGPTVYDFLHVGNFRGAVFYNFVKNWLEQSGYQVTFVYNFTDVDDKIIQRANAEKSTASAVAEKYIEEFKKDFAALRLTPHDHNPRVTQHIEGIVALIERIIARGNAYVVEGEVFFSIESFPEYGKLSNRNVNDMQSGVRIEVDPKKKNAMDFTLWKPAKPGEQSWPSPWGEGRPGWHIECSCMINDILGEQIDIHGGGMDLIFPHHENEIAQGEGASGKRYAQYWLHNNMFMFSGAKMSKSLGNIRTMRSFLEEYSGEIFKYLVMSVHYRSEAEFSEVTIANSISGLTRVYTALRTAQTHKADSPANLPLVQEFQKSLEAAEKNITAALNDDFNSPVAFAEVFEVVRSYNNKFKPGAKVTAELKFVSSLFFDFIKNFGRRMALFQEDPGDFLKQIDKMLIRQKNIDVKKIEELVERRAQARKDKNFQLSDQIRGELTAMGIEVRDAANETHWEVIK